MIFHLGLGSNIGNRRNYLETAIKELKIYPHIHIIKQSSIIETVPYGKKDQDNFLNCVIEIETSFIPEMLLKICQSIEDNLGRVRDKRWGPRTIDIDILLCGNEVINSKALTIPHPELYKRKFVLDSLVEICPDLIHPEINKTMKQILEEL